MLTLQDCLKSREPNAIITVTNLKGNFKNVQLGQAYKYDAEIDFSLNFVSKNLIIDIKNCLQSEKSESKIYQCQEGEITVFIEIIIPSTHLIMFGGNYDIYPMAKLAKEIGWKVSVICNPLKVHKSLLKLVDYVHEKDKYEEIEIDPYTVALLMAHDYETDFKNMRNLLKTSIKYIGMLGPKKRTDKMFLKLLMKLLF